MKNAIKIFFLGAVGFLSIYLVFSRFPARNSFAENGRIEISSYGLAFYGSLGNVIFTVSPLDDYYYDFFHREHVFNKLTKSDNGNFIDQLLIDLKGLFLNKKELVWNSEGENSRGKTRVKYEVKHENRKIEITRKIKFNKSKFTNVGEVIKICAGCLVTDDKQRLFINGDLVNEDKLNLATDLKKVLFALGDNQSFPQDISKIVVLSKDGRALIEIPVVGQEIFFEEEWGIVEFKTKFNLSEDATKSTQVIYINP